jgi:hypothetical protein
MGVQLLRELQDYWRLKTPIASCITWWRFKQIRGAFTIRDPQLSPEQPGDPWWFRLELLATSVRQACQQYWATGAHPAIDESMIPYFGHTRHTIKAPHTQALVISLAKSLPEHQGYILYLDNLFPNVPLANALGELGIGVMGTTRVLRPGIPSSHVALRSTYPAANGRTPQSCCKIKR